ncbi:MAG: hypothetical protein ACRD1Y_00185 [Terriglobales bacterium]
MVHLGSFRVLAVAGLATVLASGAGAQMRANPGSGAEIAAAMTQAVASLQSSVGALDLTDARLGRQEKQAVTDGKASLLQNLSQAMPRLLAAFADAPGNLGAAFRLYRDSEAVLAVAQRSASLLAAGKGATGGAALGTSTARLEDSLNELGNWIETQGSADFTTRSAVTASAASGPEKPPPPQTLVINDANTTAKPAAAKKKSNKNPHP